MKRVLITGATGFIGGRLAEVLTGLGVEVVCPVREWGRASRLARLPVRMVGADVLNAVSIRDAMAGCDVAIHCAADFRAAGPKHQETSHRGTANVMEAALGAGVSRVVHLSSAAVHGLSPRGPRPPTEDTPLRRTGHDYCDGKIAAEQVALQFHRSRGLPVSIIRPTVVYGPFGYYSRSVVRVARERRLVLVDGGAGICNCLYVDNLVQAILLAATRREAIGEVITVSDAVPVTWREYLEKHAEALGPGFARLPIISRAGLRAARRRLSGAALTVLLRSPRDAFDKLDDPVIREAVQAIPGATALGIVTKPLLRLFRRRTPPAETRRPATSGDHEVARAKGLARLLSPNEEESFSVFQHVRFGIDKAKRLLGYQPAVGFEEGMARTASWIRWAGL